MYLILGALAFVAWGLERYFKLFSRFAKGIETGVVSAILLGVFLIFVIAEAVNGNWVRSIMLVILAGIIIVYARRDRLTQDVEKERE